MCPAAPTARSASWRSTGTPYSRRTVLRRRARVRDAPGPLGESTAAPVETPASASMAVRPAKATNPYPVGPFMGPDGPNEPDRGLHERSPSVPGLQAGGSRRTSLEYRRRSERRIPVRSPRPSAAVCRYPQSARTHVPREIGPQLGPSAWRPERHMSARWRATVSALDARKPRWSGAFGRRRRRCHRHRRRIAGAGFEPATFGL
jgi:hypothetical protein